MLFPSFSLLNRSFFLLAVLIGLSQLHAQNRSITFLSTSWEEAKEIAKSEDKLIFIDFYTTWCKPCKLMDRDIFTNDDVADFFNAKFIALKIDAEKGEGIDLAKSYTVSSYPTLIVLDSEGEVFHRSVGGRSSEELIAFGEESLDPKRRLKTQRALFESGERDRDFLYRLTTACFAGNAPYEDIYQAYFEGLPKSEWGTQRSLEMIYYALRQWPFVDQRGTDILHYALTHEKEFANVRGKGTGQIALDFQIGFHLTNEIAMNPESSDADFQAAYEEVKRSGYSRSNYLLKLSESVRAKAQDDLDNWFRITDELYQTYHWEDHAFLNHHAANYQSLASKYESLPYCLKWIDRALELAQDPYYLVTRSEINKQLGHQVEALEDGKAALDLLPSDSEDREAFEKHVQALAD